MTTEDHPQRSIPFIPKRQVVILTLTHRCNLACAYCYEQNKDSVRMSPQMALDSIFSTLDSENEFDEVEFQFFGGEPFLEFETIRQVAEATWMAPRKKPYLFFATTNGTLIHGQIRDWVYRHRARFYLGLSFDGTPQMQDANRSMSSSLIDLAFFRDCWPKQSVKMTLSHETLPNLAEGVIYLHQQGFQITCNLAHGPDWSGKDTQKHFARELGKLCDFYETHPEITPCSLLTINLGLLARKKNLSKQWCGYGTNMKAIDTDGREYPCQLFMPMVLGNNSLPLSSPTQLESELCKECPLLSLCPTCYGMNSLHRGNVSSRDPIFCNLFRIQILAASRLQTFFLERFQTLLWMPNLEPGAIIRLIDGISIGQEVASQALTRN